MDNFMAVNAWVEEGEEGAAAVLRYGVQGRVRPVYMYPPTMDQSINRPYSVLSYLYLFHPPQTLKQ